MSKIIERIKGRILQNINMSHNSYQRIFWKLFFSSKRKFNIGSAGINHSREWIPTDIDLLNITVEEDWKKLLKFLQLNNIMAEHVWEHLSEKDTQLANKNCFKFLKKGGILRIAVPDGYNPDKAYIDYVKPGGNGPGADDHKILYTYKTMTDSLESVGFKVNMLEYWDENGKFHAVEWTDEGGHIVRSKRYDPRNKEGKLGYTSLIVDAVKQ